MTAPDAEKTPERRSRLMAGYDSLTLDPSPRLRQLRRQMSRPGETAIETAWTSVGRAILDAIRTVARTLGTGRSS